LACIESPQHESVTDSVRGVDEPLARRLVTLTEGFLEEELHPFHELAAVVGGGESRSTSHTARAAQGS
jgi:hypothetical protein